MNLLKKWLAILIAAALVNSGVMGLIQSAAEGNNVFTAWNENTWTVSERTIYHVAVEGAQSDDDDPNWHNMGKSAQEIVPDSNTLRGVKIPMNLTGKRAKLHMELRTEVNGSSFYAEDIPFESKGNGRFWYTFSFSEGVAVTPGARYYLAWWLVEREGGVCISYGTRGADVGHPGYLWFLSEDQEFVPLGNPLIWSFELLTDSVDVPFRTMDDDGDLPTAAGMAKAVSSNYTEGKGSVAFTIAEGQAPVGDLIFYVYAAKHVPVDASGATAMIFDLYCPDEEFAAAWSSFKGDGGVSLDSASFEGPSWNNSAGHISRESNFRPALKNLRVGWNHIIMPLDAPMTVRDCSKFKFYITKMDLTAGKTFMIDDIRFVNQAYLDSQEYEDVNRAKAVIAAICCLNDESTDLEVNDVKKRYDALSAAQQAKVSNISVLQALLNRETEEPVCVLFRDLDQSERTAQEAATSTATTENCTQGTGATLFEQASDRSGLFWYVYCESNQASTGVDITGMKYILFDFYVSDPALWTLENGDCRLAIRSVNASGWGADVAEVTAADMRAVFGSLNQGWNHLALPIKSNGKNDAFAFRMYFAGGTAKQGFYTIMDHIRFCNSAYLKSAEYDDALAAADVQAAISALDEDSQSEELLRARQDYEALTSAQKALIGNLERLRTLEAGKPLTAPVTFQPVPDNHLTGRVMPENSEFTLAAISDLHYIYWGNCQQKDVYYDSMRWLTEQAKTENLKMVVQLGDMTSSNRLYQWQVLREGLDILKTADLPYSAVIGNHDYGNGKSAGAFNTFLPAEQETKVNPYFAGAKDQGQMQNVYYTFTENGVQYMLLMLECYPSAGALSWADSVIKEHPQHNVIVYTHSYLSSENQPLGFTKEHEALAAGYNGKTMWDAIVNENSNVFMTLSAHNFNKGQSQLWVQNNAAGKPVYQVLMVDPQDYERDYGGMGFIYMMRFSDFGRTVSMEYVASRYDKDFGTDCNFTFQPELIYTEETKAAMQRKDDMDAAKAVDTLIEKIGTVTLESQKAITDAKTAYDALTDAQKAFVEKLEILTAAEKRLQELIDEQNKIVYGDVNGDGAIDAKDALMVLKASVGKLTLNETETKIADVDGNGKLDAVDALWILKKSVKKLDRFPVEE